MESLYNGNITHMVTAIRNDAEQALDILGNNYQYDQLQRIREVKVYRDANLETDNDFHTAGLYKPGSGLVESQQSAYQESYTFDKNGNLKTLKRNGNDQSHLAMDNFTYKYETEYNTTFVNNPTVMGAAPMKSAGIYGKIVKITVSAVSAYITDQNLQSIYSGIVIYKRHFQGTISSEDSQQIEGDEVTNGKTFTTTQKIATVKTLGIKL